MAKPFPLVPVLLCGGAVLLFFLVQPLMQAERVKRDAALGKVMAQAIADKDEDKALALLAGGAVADAKDAGGTPALMDAINLKQSKVVDALLAHGADVNAHRDIDGQSVLLCAVEEMISERESPALVQRLLEKGADINAQNISSQTALFRAVDDDYSDKQDLDRQAQLFRLLLAWHPDLEIRDAGGDTALRYAETEGSDGIAALLRQAGAKEHSAFPPLLHRVAAYAVTDLGPGQAEALNSRGDAVGVNSDGRTDMDEQLLGRAFLWRTGRLIHLGSLGGPSSHAFGINDWGQVVGEADTATRDGSTGPYIRHAFLWQSGQMRDLHPRVGWATKDSDIPSSARAINKTGSVAGEVNGLLFIRRGNHIREYDPARDATNSFSWDGITPTAMNSKAQIIICLQGSGSEWAGIWQSGRMHLLPPPPSSPVTIKGQTVINHPNYYAFGINDVGDIVGDADHDEAALWHRGKFSYLGGLYSLETEANGLNDKGLIVGVVSDQMEVKRPELHACLWRNGKAKDLNGLIPSRSGWTLEDARAVNDRGQIVGRGTYQGKEHAFLLTPVAH